MPNFTVYITYYQHSWWNASWIGPIRLTVKFQPSSIKLDFRFPPRRRWELCYSETLPTFWDNLSVPIFKGTYSTERAQLLSPYMSETNLFNYAFIFCCFCWFMHSSHGFVNRIRKNVFLWNFARDGVGDSNTEITCQLWNLQ
jgi:hypothetical protein